MGENRPIKTPTSYSSIEDEDPEPSICENNLYDELRPTEPKSSSKN